MPSWPVEYRSEPDRRAGGPSSFVYRQGGLMFAVLWDHEGSDHVEACID